LIVNRPSLSDKAEYTCRSRICPRCSGMSTTRADFKGLPSPAVATRPETTHKGDILWSELIETVVEACRSRTSAAPCRAIREKIIAAILELKSRSTIVHPLSMHRNVFKEAAVVTSRL
jgi:hypothetical protein